MADHDGAIKLMNVDCDLYSSTKDIFERVHGRVVPGTVIVFDECKRRQKQPMRSGRGCGYGTLDS